MKPAFTLMEVLISVVIISVVGAAMLQIGANNNKMTEYLLGRKEINRQLSFFAFADISEEDHKTTMTAYDLASKTFTINDDDIRKILEEQSFEVRYETLNSYDLTKDILGTDREDELLVDEVEGSLPEILIMVDSVEIVGDHRNARFYRIYTEE